MIQFMLPTHQLSSTALILPCCSCSKMLRSRFTTNQMTQYLPSSKAHNSSKAHYSSKARYNSKACSNNKEQGTLQQDTQQLREANPAVTAPLQQHTKDTPVIAPTASTELARLFDQFIHQAIPSQAVRPTRQPPAPLSPASIDVTLPMVQPQTPNVQQGQPQQGQPLMQPLMQPQQQGQPLM